MRSFILCALLCALTALPGLHGFPSGKNTLPVRYARGFRRFPRSPGPSRVRDINAGFTCWQDGLGCHPPRPSSTTDASRSEYVHPRPLVSYLNPASSRSGVWWSMAFPTP